MVRIYVASGCGHLAVRRWADRSIVFDSACLTCPNHFMVDGIKELSSERIRKEWIDGESKTFSSPLASETGVLFNNGSLGGSVAGGAGTHPQYNQGNPE